LTGKPVVLTVGSLTCPETLSAMPSLIRRYEDFGSEVEFVMVNVREAHPGELICQPQTFEKKVEHAQALKKQLKMPWTVVSDDLDGNFHPLLDTKPNSAYIVDGDGVIAYRSLFANDAQNLHDALSAFVASRDLAKKESLALIGRLVTGLGYFREAFNWAGPKARRHMWLVAPPFVIAGLVADRFSSLALEKRGAAALALLSAVLVGGFASLLFLLK
jgi:hypothetical protein